MLAYKVLPDGRGVRHHFSEKSTNRPLHGLPLHMLIFASVNLNITEKFVLYRS